MPEKPPPRLPELLAPAGSYEAACAALQYGADAIYLGLPRFSARADATNLTPEQFARIVRHAHSLQPRRAVYVTLNTLVQEAEIPELLTALDLADEQEADAVIVQDLGVAALARRHFPRLRLHASTQLAVHNLEGTRALAALGFTRVVLARELTFAEIADLAACAPLEIEVFVHGALCYAYSGLCLFSSMQTGRSGNRGRCAYCCRENFAADGGPPATCFSMRDLGLADDLAPLRRCGVASIKIEGRMKSALYVAAVTDLYRRQLDDRLSRSEAEALTADLRTIFSRPWTTLYAHGAQPPGRIIDAAASGHRGTPIGSVVAVRRAPDGSRRLAFVSQRALEKHDGLQVEPPGGERPFGFAVDELRLAKAARTVVSTPAGAAVEVDLPPDAPHLPAGSPVFCTASQAVRRRFAITTPREAACRPARPLRVALLLSSDGARVTVSDDDTGCEITHELAAALPPARQAAATAEAARRAFDRLGGTRWRLEQFEVADPAGCYITPTQLNTMRREALARLAMEVDAARVAQRTARLQALSAPESLAASARGAPRWSVKLDGDATARVFPGEPEVVIRLGAALTRDPEGQLARWLAVVPRACLRLALPLIVRAPERATLEAAVSTLLAGGWERWEVADLAGCHLLRRLAPRPLSLTADWSCFAFNRVACQAWAAWGIEALVASPEMSAANLDALARQSSPALLALLYQHAPLFISETPPLSAGVDATGRLRLRDRRGERFLARVIEGRWVTVAEAPYSLAAERARLETAGARGWRVDFSWSPLRDDELDACWRQLRAGSTPVGGHSGNYRRGLH